METDELIKNLLAEEETTTETNPTEQINEQPSPTTYSDNISDPSNADNNIDGLLTEEATQPEAVSQRQPEQTGATQAPHVDSATSSGSPTQQITQTPEQQKRGRGRPRKDAGTPSQENSGSPGKGAAPQSGIGSAKISTSNPLDFSAFKETTISSTAGPQAEQNAAKYLTGAILLMMIDAVIPSLVIKLLSYSDEKYKALNVKKVKLSTEQFTQLEPLANEAVKQIVIQLSPLAAFFLTAGVLYTGNVISATNE